jgi:plastocyanin
MRTYLVVTVVSLLIAACGSSEGGNPPTNPPSNPPTSPPTSPPTNPPSGNTVTMGASTFTPPNLQVTAGTTVTWVNGTPGTTHTITPQGHTQWQRVETSAAGTVLTVTFSTPGTYNYFCEPHGPTMSGTITVQ